MVTYLAIQSELIHIACHNMWEVSQQKFDEIETEVEIVSRIFGEAAKM